VDDIHKFMLSIVPHIQVHAERIDGLTEAAVTLSDLQQPCPTMIGIS
jgi:hypothetical protein